MNRTCRISEEDMLVEQLSNHIDHADIQVSREGRIAMRRFSEDDLPGVMKVITEWRDVINRYYVINDKDESWLSDGYGYAKISDMFPYRDVAVEKCLERLTDFMRYNNTYQYARECPCGGGKPSFFIEDDKGILRCKACGKSVTSDSMKFPNFYLVRDWNRMVENDKSV